MHHSSNITKSVKPYFQGCIWGTNTKCNNTTILYLNHIPSPFHILSRNAQSLFNLPPLFFFDSPFSSKGKRRKWGWLIEVDDWHLRPYFSTFTANSLNRIMRIWVRFKRHHRTGIVATILFFQLSDAECTVVKSRQKPVSSYIQLPSLAMFSLQSPKMPC